MTDTPFRYAAPSDECDLIMKGGITSGVVFPRAITELATRYRFNVTVSVKVDDVKQQKTLWENPSLVFSDEYELQNQLSAGDAAAQGASFLAEERALMERLSTDFARSVVSSILEAF